MSAGLGITILTLFYLTNMPVSMATWSARYELVQDDNVNITTVQKIRAAIQFLQNSWSYAVVMSKEDGSYYGHSLEDFKTIPMYNSKVYILKTYVQDILSPPEELYYVNDNDTVDYTTTLSGQIGEGSTFAVTIRPLGNCKKFVVMLKNTPTKVVILRLRVQFDIYKASIMYAANGIDQDIEIVPTFPFLHDTTMTLAFTVHNTCTQIDFNGQFLYNYTHRQPPSTIDRLAVFLGETCDLLLYKASASFVPVHL